VLAPQRVDRQIRRDDAVRIESKQREERAKLLASDRDDVPVDARLDWAEEQDLEARRWLLGPRIRAQRPILGASTRAVQAALDRR
jgi:hypothetical protein